MQSVLGPSSTKILLQSTTLVLEACDVFVSLQGVAAGKLPGARGGCCSYAAWGSCCWSTGGELPTGKNHHAAKHRYVQKLLPDSSGTDAVHCLQLLCCATEES